jgi:hypothetical protein
MDYGYTAGFGDFGCSVGRWITSRGTVGLRTHVARGNSIRTVPHVEDLLLVTYKGKTNKSKLKWLSQA